MFLSCFWLTWTDKKQNQTNKNKAHTFKVSAEKTPKDLFDQLLLEANFSIVGVFLVYQECLNMALGDYAIRLTLC